MSARARLSRCRRCGLLAVLLLLAACGTLRDVPSPFSSPTPVLPPTPVGNTLRFLVPSYRTALTAGQYVPGTRMGLISSEADSYTVEIDGQPAIKRAGDSFFWRGVVAPAVMGEYNLFIERTSQAGTLVAAGQVTLTVFEPQPVEGAPAPGGPNVLAYDGIVLDYLVPIGRGLPGTSLVIEGFQANQVTFSGTAFYPLLLINDSLTWKGTVRPNVYIENTMQLLAVDETGLRLRGSAIMRIDSRSQLSP